MMGVNSHSWPCPQPEDMGLGIPVSARCQVLSPHWWVPRDTHGTGPSNRSPQGNRAQLNTTGSRHTRPFQLA